MAWREDITLALQNLGGEANLNDIYTEIMKLKDGKVTRNFDATDRQTIETASSDSRVWKEGNPDLFKNFRIADGHYASQKNSNHPTMKYLTELQKMMF